MHELGNLVVSGSRRIYSFVLKLDFDGTGLFLSYPHFINRIKWYLTRFLAIT